MGSNGIRIASMNCRGLGDKNKRRDVFNYLKANMNSDKPLQTAAIFFSDELLFETGYWLGACHG